MDIHQRLQYCPGRCLATMILWLTGRARLYLVVEQLVRVLAAARLPGRPPRSVTDGCAVRSSVVAQRIAEHFPRQFGRRPRTVRLLLYCSLVGDSHMAIPGVHWVRFPVGNFRFLAEGSIGYRLDHTCEVGDRKSTRLNSSHSQQSRMPSSA